MLTADLYVDRIQLLPYLSPEDWQGAGEGDGQKFLEKLRTGAIRLQDCAHIRPQKRFALSLALRAQEIMPPVMSLELPRPVPSDLFEINEPGPEAPVLVSGNSEFTLSVLTGVLATTVSPFYLLLVDCRGDTVDMAMVYESFTPERLARALAAQAVADKVSHRHLIISGWCAPIQAALSLATGWEIQVGPVCAAELPLFMGERWQMPAGSDT